MREDLYDRSMGIGSFYHIYNRGVAKNAIFSDNNDYQRLLETISFYLDDKRSSKLSTARKLRDALPLLTSQPIAPIANIHAYCLMSNHFHLLLEEVTEGGISRFMRRVLLSYTRYFNTRHNRVGPLFQGTFRFVRVEDDEQFLHLTRYIHLNPYVARIVDDPERYPWSSYSSYRQENITRLCDPSLALKLAGSPANYREFLIDFASYARDLELIKHHAIDETD